MTTHAPHIARTSRITGLLLIAGISAIVFWTTAYPTITWWDSSQYSVAAVTLGVPGPPGSLLLTLLGWPVARLPLGMSTAHQLNLFAGLLAAIATGLVYLVALQLHRLTNREGDGAIPGTAVVVGAALGALTFAFSDTLWEHATKFTPYVLTVVFTGVILWTMLRWWEEADRPDSWRRLALLGLLFGLDFSVHRTNALLLPSALAWILLRQPRALLQSRAWLAGGGGLVAGLAVQLLIIPIAASTGSILNSGDASNWSRFWDYVSLEQLGGGFLVQFFPRKAPFWSRQVADFLQVFRFNFLHWAGRIGPAGVLPALVGLFGLIALCRRDRRLGIAFTAVLLLQAATTVLYFNIPASFFRPFDRHYLPVCMTFAVAIAYGMGAMMGEIGDLSKARRRLVAAIASVIAVLAPASQLFGNWQARDASGRYFTRDSATNALEGLPANAIFFTMGDNDTFPVWYVQAVEGVRTDVQIINLNLANVPWYVDQIARRDPSFPLSLNRQEREALSTSEWTDTTVIPVVGTADQLGVAADTRLPDTITLRTRPSSGSLGPPSEAVLLDIVRTNRWRRPLAFGITVSKGGMGWLEPYGRLDGLFWRVVPVLNPPVVPETLRTNLLEIYSYRGYADSSVRLEEVSRNFGVMLYQPFLALLEVEQARGETARCHVDAARLLGLLPPERFAGFGPDRAAIEGGCARNR